SLHGVTAGRQRSEWQTDPERSGVSVRIYFRGREQRCGAHLEPVAEEDKTCTKISGIKVLRLLKCIGIVGLKEHVERLLLGKEARDARNDSLAAHFERRSSELGTEPLTLGLHLG